MPIDSTMAFRLLVLSAALLMPAAVRADEQERYFETTIRPILAEHCFECHGPKKQMADLRLDSPAFLQKGNESGPALVAGKPDESRIIQVVRYPDDDYQMPPKAKLAAEQIAALEEWVKNGAVWPASAISPDAVPTAPDAWKKHWAFQPVTKPEPPAVKNSAWVKSPVDQFVAAKLEEKGLAPSPVADRRTLIRRVTFGLTGLPPTAEEIAAFEQDKSPNAVAALVDRLLDSPRYGERWGRYWLDVARYADTKGYVFQEDRNYPNAYMYRDWVIDALNSDMPYDRFLMLQIAADRLVPKEDEKNLSAMGFLTLGRRFLNNQHDIFDDRIDVITRGTMAMTVSCARCHDHKYDPIPTKDYYGLYAVFLSSQEPKDLPGPPRLVDKEKPQEIQVFLRGNPANRGEMAKRQFLMCLSGEDRQPFKDGSGRLELAQQIASPTNPLTARVLVNRVWGHHFGTGLVRTPSDFGTRSDPPTHPELLDYLASRFVEEGWSMKKLHRWILNSATWQQQSTDRPECRKVDPENALLWRQNRRRLDFEANRDTLLAAAGQLDLTVGGPAVKLTESPFPKRRTVYGFIDRQNLPGMFRTFDFASPDTHSPQRYSTTVPQQALFLLNSPFVIEQAQALARRTDDPKQNDATRIRALYRLVYGRDAAPQEVALGMRFIGADKHESGESVVASSWDFGYGAFDSGSQRIRSFQRLPHWTGSAWQGGKKLPDPKTGWCVLRDKGGHTGNDLEHAVIRRWTAPRDLVVSITGRLKHPSDQGDGVQSRIVSNRTGVAGEWVAQKSETDTNVARIEVKQGETLDFVTDCRSNPNHDSFEWTVTLRAEQSSQGGGEQWSSADGFRGPLPAPLGPWERYAQVLLLSNELVFVD